MEFNLKDKGYIAKIGFPKFCFLFVLLQIQETCPAIIFPDFNMNSCINHYCYSLKDKKIVEKYLNYFSNRKA